MQGCAFAARLQLPDRPGVPWARLVDAVESGLASQAGRSARPAPYIADNVQRCAAGAAARAKPTTTREMLQ
jgi:hypothetical protein